MASSICERLFALRDEKYRAFNAKLIPTVDPATMIGVRTPALRALAKELNGTQEANALLLTLPHDYYEENCLHGFLIEKIKDFDACIAALDAFLPYVDNWATCDQMRPNVFKKHLDALYPHILRWMDDAHPYTIRFGVEMLMTFYLDDAFRPEQMTPVAQIQNEDYYVRMMIAWYFATALAKQYDAVLPVLKNRLLPAWTHNKTIQKAIESYRVTDGQKAYLRSLKV